MTILIHAEKKKIGFEDEVKASVVFMKKCIDGFLSMISEPPRNIRKRLKQKKPISKLSDSKSVAMYCEIPNSLLLFRN